MKILQNLFGKGSVIGAPAAGELVSIREVSDDTFREEILGTSAAIRPAEGKFYAPADGKVATVFATGHAAAITTQDRAEVLIHIGLDTVKLKGRYFTVHVKEGQQVKKGDLLIEADLEKISAEGYDTITPVVICNSDRFARITLAPGGPVAQGDVIMTLGK